MSKITKSDNLLRRKLRVRKVVSGTSKVPRLSVYVSNKQVTAQVIDDISRITLAYATSVGQKLDGKTMTEKAAIVGKEIAEKSKAKKIKKVVFDRNGRLYHGRVKAVADSARTAGLEF